MLRCNVDYLEKVVDPSDNASPRFAIVFALAAGMILAAPIRVSISADGAAPSEIGKLPDPRESIDSALRLYIRLLEKKEVDKFLEAALGPGILKTYHKPENHKIVMDALKGPQREIEIYTMRKALERKPRLWNDSVNHDRAEFKWNDDKYGTLIIDLKKKDGKWYLNW